MEEEECVSVFFGQDADQTFEELNNKFHKNIRECGSQNMMNMNDDSDPNSSQESSQKEDSNIDKHPVSQLDILEQKPLNIPHFFNISPRAMPLSPHYVFEEEFSNNPWILLVATIFLTKTSGKTARPFMQRFFDEFPTPYAVLDASPSTLEMYFESLGLRKRGRMIWRMTHQFVSAKWRRASDLCGVGKYGEDAYRMFCLGHTDLEPGDRYLKLYLDWLRGHTAFLQDWGAEDCEHVIEDPVVKYYAFTLREFSRS